ncbi:carbonic anhydrase [Carboxylicivirga sediminis]|uniref:carbonic anhydrase n=1 Tax=Carboxylicivirga sediminis TaxID=2006564 RepID=A0A941F4X0_9BACT|nr:carbonic anhydrase [Carboxylicivirga sediminis]MBR8536876.1 carbonic anhydrase [Carboxylicivirga sediminis]
MKSYDQIFLANRAWAQTIKNVDEDYFKNLSLGQAPKYFWIGCADSRMAETVITRSQLGQFFVHRNVANLVHEEDASLMAALSFAVNTLGVKHIVVAGHTNCGGIKAALEGTDDKYLDNWIGEIRETLNDNIEEIDGIKGNENKANRLAELSVIKQVDRLASMEILKDAWGRGQRLFVHGWIFDIATGELNSIKEIHPDDMIK